MCALQADATQLNCGNLQLLHHAWHATMTHQVLQVLYALYLVVIQLQLDQLCQSPQVVNPGEAAEAEPCTFHLAKCEALLLVLC